MSASDAQVPVLRPSDAVNLPPEGDGREHLSHTSLGVLNACKQKFDYQYLQRLETISRSRPLGMGSAYQKAIEMQDPEAGAALLREGFEIRSQEDEDRLQIEEAIVQSAARLYLKKWPDRPEEQREYAYRVRLRNPWTGHYSNTFDLLGYADATEDMGSHWMLTENKLVGRIDGQTVRLLPLDQQVRLECYGIWRATGKEVREVNYRWVKKPSIKQRKGRPLKDGTLKGAETVSQFIDRLTADYEERPDFYAHEETYFRTADDLLRVEEELWVFADELRAARRRALFPRNTARCGDFGGCQFIPLCLGDSDAASLFRVRDERPDPTAAHNAALDAIEITAARKAAAA